LNSISLEKRAKSWAETFVNPDRLVCVSETDGKITGFYDAGASRDGASPPGTAELYAIHVLPSEWGKGGGRHLINPRARGSCESGVCDGTLWVLERNARARRFYEAAGFRTDGGEKTTRLGDTVMSEVRYRKALGKTGPNLEAMRSVRRGSLRGPA